MKSNTLVIDDLFFISENALKSVDQLLNIARIKLTHKTFSNGKIDADKLEKKQFISHGLAWMATYQEALKSMLDWAKRLEKQGSLGELESLILQCAFGEYLSQLSGGIPLSQVETIRPHDLEISTKELKIFLSNAVLRLQKYGNNNEVRMRIAELIENNCFGSLGLAENHLLLIKDQFQKFADEQIIPYAHDWHLKNALIPIELINQMSALGVLASQYQKSLAA